MSERALNPGRLCAALALAGLACGLSSVGRASAAESPAQLSATTSATEVSIGETFSVSGTLSEAGHGLASVTLALQASAFPFHGFRTVARVSTAADGSYDFAAPAAERNVRLRVLSEAPSVRSATIAVYVDPLATLHERSLGPGRAQLTLRLRHTLHGGAGDSTQANWYVAAPGTRVFRLLATTPTRELAPGLSYASAIIDPPAKRFVYRVCLNPVWERAMGRVDRHGRCPRGDYAVGHSVG